MNSVLIQTDLMCVSASKENRVKSQLWCIADGDALILPSVAVVNVRSGKTHVAQALRMTKQPKTTFTLWL